MIPCQFKASEIADLLDGTLTGEDQTIIGLVPLDRNIYGTLSFSSNNKSSKYLGVLLSTAPLEESTTIIVGHPKVAMAKLIESLKIEEEPHISPLAEIHPTAIIGKGVTIHAGTVIGENCHVMEKSILYPNVVLYPKTVIGKRCRIHSGAVIGSDGFAYEQLKGEPYRISHWGGVIIEDDVEIGANSCVDQGMLEPTRIGKAVKIDNLVHVGHNVDIQAGTIIAAQSGISGSAKIGKGVLLGGQVGVSDHSILDDGVQVAAKSGVHGHLVSGEKYFGIPALPKKKAFEILRAVRHLPKWMRR